MNILVVDPEQSGYDGLLRAAAAEGCEICFLATGRAVLRQKHEMRSDLLTVNVELPDFSGFDLVEMMQPFCRDATVLLVADQYAAEDEVRALELGIGSYLCKPLEGSVLYECRSFQKKVLASH
jgi:DNA-binding response OmpR family regulator